MQLQKLAQVGQIMPLKVKIDLALKVLNKT